MVLPPSAAIHPVFGDITFGELRQKLVAGDVDSIQLACSNSDFSSNDRILHSTPGTNTTCATAAELYCWHQCQNTTTFNVSKLICALQSRELKCISSKNEIWSGETHGNYFPGCAGKDWKVEGSLSTTNAPSKAPSVTATIAPTQNSCGLFGLSIFCLGAGECGFVRRLFNMNGC